MDNKNQQKELNAKYALGEQVGRILGQTWRPDGTFLIKGSYSQRSPQQERLLKALEREHELDRERLLARFRMFRAWPRRRFQQLVGYSRRDGTPLFSFRLLQLLQSEKLTTKVRTRLESRLIRTQMPSEAFLAEIRQGTGGSAAAAPRKVADPLHALRRFQATALKLNGRFQLLKQGLELIANNPDERTPQMRQMLEETRQLLKVLIKRVELAGCELREAIRLIER